MERLQNPTPDYPVFQLSTPDYLEFWGVPYALFITELKFCDSLYPLH